MYSYNAYLYMNDFKPALMSEYEQPHNILEKSTVGELIRNSFETKIPLSYRDVTSGVSFANVPGVF